MKNKKILGLSFILLTLLWIMTGCLTLSVHPLYFEEDLIFEEGLIGTWGPKDAEKNLSELWIFKKAGDNEYRLIIKEKGSQDGVFEARLLKLGKYMFLDIFPEEPDTGNEFFNMHLIPAHSFLRVSLQGHVLQLALFDLEWLKNNIEKKKIKIKHERRDDLIVLTASTKELQELVLEHIEEAFVFEDEGLHRFW